MANLSEFLSGNTDSLASQLESESKQLDALTRGQNYQGNLSGVQSVIRDHSMIILSVVVGLTLVLVLSKK